MAKTILTKCYKIARVDQFLIIFYCIVVGNEFFFQENFYTQMDSNHLATGCMFGVYGWNLKYSMKNKMSTILLAL